MEKNTSYCGLDCAHCFIHDGQVTKQALKLLAKFKEIEFEKWAKALAEINPREMSAFAKQEACYDVLQAWEHMRCVKSCQDGGGSQQCAIRDCCRKKKFAGCWLCDAFETCPTLGTLKPINGDSNINNIRQIRAAR